MYGEDSMEYISELEDGENLLDKASIKKQDERGSQSDAESEGQIP